MTEIYFEKTYSVTVKVSTKTSSTLSETELRKVVEEQVDHDFNRTVESFGVVAGCCTDDYKEYTYKCSRKTEET